MVQIAGADCSPRIRLFTQCEFDVAAAVVSDRMVLLKKSTPAEPPVSRVEPPGR
jgi:hypothetical protein